MVAGLSFHPLAPGWVVAGVGGVAALWCVYQLIVGRGAVRGMWAGRILLIAALAALACRPALPGETTMAEQTEIDVVIVLDTTTSMSATDGDDSGTSRLQRASDDLTSIVDAFVGARYAIVEWDRMGRLVLPWTTDATAARSALAVARVEAPTNSRGSTVGVAHDVLAQLLGSHERNEPERSVFLVVAGDGEETRGGTPSSFRDLDRYVEDGVVIGYGTAAGAPMDVRSVKVVDPRSGEVAVSMRDEAGLRSLAADLGIHYTPREDLQPVESPAVPRPLSGREDSGLPGGRVGVSWLLALPVAAWMTVEVGFASARTARLWRDVPRGGA